jgi:hypothetical protein
LDFKFDKSTEQLEALRTKCKDLRLSSSASVKPEVDNACLTLERNFINVHLLQRVRQSMNAASSKSVLFAFYGEIGVDTRNGIVSHSHDSSLADVGGNGTRLRLTLSDHNLTYAPANLPLARPGAVSYVNAKNGIHKNSDMGTSLIGVDENPQQATLEKPFNERVYFLRSFACEADEDVESEHMVNYDTSHYHDKDDALNIFKSLPLVGNVENRVLLQQLM